MERKRKKIQLTKAQKNKLALAIINVSNRVSVQQLVKYIIAVFFCYFFTALSTFIPEFSIEYYNSSDAFLWNVGLILTMFVQTTAMFFAKFFKGISILFLMFTFFNPYLLIGSIPLFNQSIYLELLFPLIITMMIYVLITKNKLKDSIKDENDPIISIINYEHTKLKSKLDLLENKKSEMTFEEYEKEHKEIMKEVFNF